MAFLYNFLDFEIVNANADFASAGSPSACSIQEGICSCTAR